ncbi:hypothetical protein AB0958_44330, partial [Streptomyces sp. NPDC006655]
HSGLPGLGVTRHVSHQLSLPARELHRPPYRPEREGWLGEVEGLQVSLAGAEDKLAQLHAEQSRRGTAIDLGMPTFAQIAIRTSVVKEPAP